MSEEQTKRPVTITREELYRQVWATPMMRLGEQYGISGNGLKKICDRLNVPYASAYEVFVSDAFERLVLPG